MRYDFAGWATRNDLKCSDGRTIKKNAFIKNDGETVPLVWSHQHNEPFNVLGHALLENKEEGVYTYCTFNETEAGQQAKALVEHGDITALSIYANGLQQKGGDVLHGNIREVSLVLAGANPGAFIESVISHGEESSEEGIIYTGEPLAPGGEAALRHAEEKKEEAPEKKAPEKDEAPDKEETVQDVFDTLNEKQKTVVYALIGQAIEDAKGDEEEDEGGNTSMKHNVFDQETESRRDVLSHADQQDILELAKKSNVGTLKQALEIYAEENELQHDAVAGGFVQPPAEGNVTLLFPDYKDARPGGPELITNDQGWIGTVMQKVHKSPISRIRTRYVDIRNLEELRAKGYQKGKEKTLSGNFELALRTTDPQTVYVKNALHRDDVLDITDFDYVQYLYNIDRMMLNEELATAIMLGDGRANSSPDKIQPDKIRPIWTDDDLFTIHVDLDLAAAKAELQGSNTGANFGENYITAEAMVNTCLYSREKFKGSGRPDLYCTPHMVNVMLLARDLNGRRIYSNVSELAAALNVGAIYTAEQFEGKTRTAGTGASAKTKELVGLIVNLADYSLGATKGGEITHFTQFDIDFNQNKSLIETRCSGALTRLWSAIAIEKDVSKPASGGNG